MAQSEKYGRTHHYPFSPGTTSDDRINFDYWVDMQQIRQLVHTEKLDGENNCLSRYGVFARSHAAPTTSPWTTTIRQYWQTIRNELNDLEIFLENCYAIHSLQYRKLDHHFYVFAVRDKDVWLSWEETKFYASLLDLPTVPEIAIVPAHTDQRSFKDEILNIVSGAGAFEPVETHTGEPATMEGVVSRDTASYSTKDFQNHVFKYVRKGHVQTSDHWTRHWKRAPLIQEGGNHVEII